MYPAVIAMIVEKAPAVVDWAKQWTPSEKVTGKFGQKGLERRSRNLRTTIESLSKKSPDLSRSLRPVVASLDDADQMLEVAAVLPLVKRKKAHRDIADVLDDLEKALFGSVNKKVDQDSGS